MKTSFKCSTMRGETQEQQDIFHFNFLVTVKKKQVKQVTTLLLKMPTT